MRSVTDKVILNIETGEESLEFDKTQIQVCWMQNRTQASLHTMRAQLYSLYKGTVTTHVHNRVDGDSDHKCSGLSICRWRVCVCVCSVVF